MVGCPISMCEGRTMTSGPASDWRRLAMQWTMSFASLRREPWSISRIAFIPESYSGAQAPGMLQGDPGCGLEAVSDGRSDNCSGTGPCESLQPRESVPVQLSDNG